MAHKTIVLTTELRELDGHKQVGLAQTRSEEGLIRASEKEEEEQRDREGARERERERER